MNLEALVRAAQILRSQPAYAMPLARLHARLCEELGPDVGTYGQVYHQLKNRPQSFTMIDTPRLLDTATEMPLQLRAEYDRALQEAGLGSCTRVALTEIPPDNERGVLAMAAETMGELWLAAENDPVLRALLSRAAEQLEEISRPVEAAAAERPTTRPRDLPKSR